MYHMLDVKDCMCTYPSVYVRTNVHIYVCMHEYALCMYTCMHLCIYVYMYACVYVWMYLCVYVLCKCVVGSESFWPDIQKLRQMENAVRDI